MESISENLYQQGFLRQSLLDLDDPWPYLYFEVIPSDSCEQLLNRHFRVWLDDLRSQSFKIDYSYEIFQNYQPGLSGTFHSVRLQVFASEAAVWERQEVINRLKETVALLRADRRIGFSVIGSTHYKTTLVDLGGIQGVRFFERLSSILSRLTLDYGELTSAPSASCEYLLHVIHTLLKVFEFKSQHRNLIQMNQEVALFHDLLVDQKLMDRTSIGEKEFSEKKQVLCKLISNLRLRKSGHRFSEALARLRSELEKAIRESNWSPNSLTPELYGKWVMQRAVHPIFSRFHIDPVQEYLLLSAIFEARQAKKKQTVNVQDR